MKTLNEQLITAILLQEEAWEKVEEVCDKEMIAFSLFCAENYIKSTDKNLWWVKNSMDNYTIEELLTIYKTDYANRRDTKNRLRLS